MPSRWRRWEIDYLSKHAGNGAQAVAEKLGRSAKAVQNMASRLGISLREISLCPNCGQETYLPLSPRTGWCRACTISASRDSAALRNRAVRFELQAEERRIKELKRERQAHYSDTNKRKGRLRELRERDGNHQVRKEK